MSLRLLQINLHHSKAASAALVLRLTKGGADLVLVQELIAPIDIFFSCKLHIKGFKKYLIKHEHNKHFTLNHSLMCTEELG